MDSSTGLIDLKREKPGRPCQDTGVMPDDMRLLDTGDAPGNFLEQWPENGEFYRATQHAIPGFVIGYLVAYQADIRIAVIPYFLTDFKLNTMLQGRLLKRMLGDLSLRIACVGHPSAAFGRIDGQISAALLDGAFAALSAKAPVVAFKGFGPDLPLSGFVRVAGLPAAVLHLGRDFWSTLHGHKIRNDIKRKLKAAASLRFEAQDGLPVEYLERIYQLYLGTRSHAAIQFECVSAAYFINTSAQSIYILAFLQDRLVGFAQMLHKGDKLVGKYLGMDYAVSRAHELYFSLYLQALDIATQRRFSEIEFGETSYAFKKELGCELIDTWVYYRHRNPIAQAVLARFAFLLKPSAKDLR